MTEPDFERANDEIEELLKPSTNTTHRIAQSQAAAFWYIALELDRIATQLEKNGTA